ncbi:MAG: F0F1 ATP synthase subunit gamma, partial [Aeromicrobium sp.]
MAASVRELRAKIRSTQATKKITRAMELIAASRIIMAKQRAAAAAPYARELTRAVSAVATFSNVDHPLTTEKENPTKAAVLVISSDRGLAGAYSSAVLKEAERLVEKLHGEGKEVELYLSGRKAEAYYNFRSREFIKSWVGVSDQPQYSDAPQNGNTQVRTLAVDDTHDSADPIDP